MGARAQSLELSSIALLGHKQRVRQEVEQPVHESVPIWDASTSGRGLICYISAPGPLAATCYYLYTKLLASILLKNTRQNYVKFSLGEQLERIN